MSCILKAYRVSSTQDWGLEPAAGKREWMDRSQDKFAYRCLPLVMANQAGWVATCPFNFSAIWNGKNDMNSIALRFPEGEGNSKGHVKSHFGNGVITFSLPWLFRTSPGYGLWARGPSNNPKDNIIALDGIIETDWAPYTFTMNWKIMRRNTEVFFRKGEPVCLLVPFPLGLLESVQPEFREIDEDPVLKQDFFYFTSSRSANIKKIASTGESAWAMDYMRGHMPDGTEVTTHRKAFKLQEFTGEKNPPPKPPAPEQTRS
ncbi:hypothetical protein PHYC_03208 [Phycisphaerales bacterium]|nr:hypothetical protein PHYC_03208 [Phycisphaerales bacterium]